MKNPIAKAQIKVLSSPLSVYNAFVDADTMSKFWFTRRDNGLVKGSTVYWYVGDTPGAFAIEVKVVDLVSGKMILIEWGHRGTFTQVEWRIEATEDGNSILAITESGFIGSDAEIIENVLDSTGGFNQVVVALKALLEHNSPINVVADHI